MLAEPVIPLSDNVSGTNSATDTTVKTVIAAPGAGHRLYITTIILDNNDAAVNTHVDIQDGNGVKLMRVAAPLDNGKEIVLPRPLRLPENSPLQFKATVAATTLTVSAVGFKAN